MIALDIETVANITPESSYFLWLRSKISAPANYSKAESIEQYKLKAQGEIIEKAPLDPRTGKIVLIGLLSENKIELHPTDPSTNLMLETLTPDTTPLYYYGIFNKHNEMALLNDFLDVYTLLYENGAGKMVTFNGKDFDVPFIQKRLLLTGIDRGIPYDDPMGLTYPYSDRAHIDIRRYLEKGTLAEWGFLLGFSDSPSSKGNEIAEMFREDKIEDIKWKNAVDLFLTYRIAKKLERVK